MKHVLFSLAALLIAGAAFSQTAFGVKAGPNFASYTLKTAGSKSTSDLKTNVALGVFANVPLAPDFYFQPNLMYEGKGGNAKSSDQKTRLSYLTLPLDLMYAPSLGTNKVFIGFGPYLGVGLSGKTKSTSSGGTTVSVDPFKQSDGLKRFDAGADLEAGYQFSQGLQLGLNAEMGLLNLQQGGNSDNAFHNTSFGVFVGYAFGK